jgi:hypothetical protein
MRSVSRQQPPMASRQPGYLAQVDLTGIIPGAASHRLSSQASTRLRSPSARSSSPAYPRLTSCRISIGRGPESASSQHKLDLCRVSSILLVPRSTRKIDNGNFTYLLPMQLRGPTLKGCRTSLRSSGNADTSMNLSGMNSSGLLKFRGE